MPFSDERVSYRNNIYTRNSIASAQIEYIYKQLGWLGLWVGLILLVDFAKEERHLYHRTRYVSTYTLMYFVYFRHSQWYKLRTPHYSDSPRSSVAGWVGLRVGLLS